MLVAIVTDEAGKQEWLAQGMQAGMDVSWLDKPATVSGADAYIDLLFSEGAHSKILSANRVTEWQQFTSSLVIINDTMKVVENLPLNFIRINGWPTFLQRPVVEAAQTGIVEKRKAAVIFTAFNKTVEWVPDVPGFISARVVSMIINEAYFALEDEVSTKEAIDTAMKLGTNYPFGPFEWSEKIGLKNVYTLLATLAASNSRYHPSPLLIKEALS